MSTPRTPKSIFSASILMFVYGGLLLFCSVCGAATTAFQPKDDAMGMQAALEQEVPGHFVFGIVSNSFSILLGLMFIISGMGVLRLVKSFRMLAYVTCAGILLSTIGSSVFAAVYIFPIQQRVMVQEMQKANNANMPPNFNQTMNTIMTASLALGLLIAICIPLLFCVPTVILLNVKSARDAFDGVLPEPDEADPYAIRRKPDRYDDDEVDTYDDDDRPATKPHSPGDTGITDKGQ